MTAMKTVDAAEPVISFLAGHARSTRAVIAFAGVKASLGGVEVQEFSTSLKDSRGGDACIQRPVAFVRERPARWYNSMSPELLAPFCKGHADKAIVTLGNSMGGFAAILFGTALPGVKRSISFCPQFSVHPELCPWERRWQDEIAAIDYWRFPTCVPRGPAAPGSNLQDHIIFCGSSRRDDLRHVEAIVEASQRPVTGFIIHDCGHDVARVLKKKATLASLLALLIDDLASPDAVSACLHHHKIPFDILDQDRAQDGDGD